MDCAHELQRIYNTELELVSLDTREGAQLAATYELMNYPAFLALDSHGTPMQTWSDGQVPLMNELEYFIKS